jgi:DNA-3-methyladenine glycosylase II
MIHLILKAKDHAKTIENMHSNKILRTPDPAISHLASDQILKKIIEETDLTFSPPTHRIYDDLIEAIIYQQVSIKAAKTIFERFCHLFDGKVPNPGRLIDTNAETLRSVGISRQKANYVINIARYFQESEICETTFRTMHDDEIIETLTSIKGVGVWTVQMMLIFSLGRPDVFPEKDLGIQAAMKEIYGFSAKGKDLLDKINLIAIKWQPYRSFATRILWRWKRKQMGLEY